MKNIKINDPEKGLIEYSLKNTIKINNFNKILESKKDNFILQKVADIVYSPKLAAKYTYKNKTDLWSREKEGFVYVIAADHEIVKIGMTEKTLSSRFSSYKAGTAKARKKGTCSVTNYYCSEFIRQALLNKSKLEIYAYHVPTKYIRTNILGVQQRLIAKQAYAFEDALLKVYQDQRGEVPALCRNTSLT
jgi:hypothetical protein